MNKRFIRVVLFGALAFASTSTFVGCSDYDEDIDNLQQQINTNKDAIAKLQDLVGAGKWVTKVEGIEGGIKVTMNDGSTTEIKSIGKDGADGINGVDGKDGSVVEIRDGYWYIDGVNQNIKAKGDKGDKGETGAAGDKGETGATGDKGETGATGAAGADGHDVKVGANGKLQVWDATEGKYVDTAFEASGAFVVKDGNYWNLNVLNKDTNQYETIKLPATEIQGVTGLTIMGDLDPLTFKYNAVTHGNAATAAEWKGPKGAPVENQVLFADLKPIIVQVTPYNFDLTTAKPQIVNSLGEEAPFTIDVKPYVSDQPLTRAASANGLWEITITGLKEGISKEDFEKALKVSANSIKFALKSGEFLGTYGDISFDGTEGSEQAAVKGEVLYNGAAVTSNVPTGKEVTLSLGNASGAAGIYDSYLTVTASSEGDAKEYGIIPKGMSFTANEKAAGQTVTFTLHQLLNNGSINESVNDLAVTFAAGTVTPDAPITINYVVTDVAANQGAVVNFGTALTSISAETAAIAETIEWEFKKADGTTDAGTDVPFKAPTTPASDYLNASGTVADLSSNANIRSNIKTVVKTTLPKNNYDDNAKPGKYIANFIIKDAKHNQLKVVPVEINVTLPSADAIVTRKVGFFDGNTLMARLSAAKTSEDFTFDMASAYTYLNDAVKGNVVMEDKTHDVSPVAYDNTTGKLSATNLANFWDAQTSYTPTTMKVTYKVAGNANFAVELPSFDAQFVSALEGSSLSKTKLYVGAEAKEYQIGDIKINLLGGLGSIDLKTSDGAKPIYVKDFTISNGNYITAGSVDDSGLKFTVGSYGQATEDNIIISIKDHNGVVTEYPVTVYFKDAPAS